MNAQIYYLLVRISSIEIWRNKARIWKYKANHIVWKWVVIDIIKEILFSQRQVARSNLEGFVKTRKIASKISIALD